MMAYGQTSSGKTHTLFGDEAQKGIVPRFLDDIFAKLREFEACEESTIRLRYSFFEIYKEKILDALDEVGGQNLSIHDGRRGVYIQNLTERESTSLEKVRKDLDDANSRRRINETYMNGRSSRSHFVITFELEINYLIEYEELAGEAGREQAGMRSNKELSKANFYEVTKKSKIIFVDLAGSERQTHNRNETLEEGCHINKSLSILNMVVSALSKSKSTDFIHYRDSTLTHFLKDIFSGNSHFNIIGTVLPQHKYASDTLNTLNFVSLAKSVKTNPKINFETKNNAQMMQTQIRSLLLRIEELERGDCSAFSRIVETLLERLVRVASNLQKSETGDIRRVCDDIGKFIDYADANPVAWPTLEQYKEKVEDLTFTVTETLGALDSNMSNELKLILKRFEKTLSGLSVNLRSLKSEPTVALVREPLASSRPLLKGKTLAEDSFANPELVKALRRNTDAGLGEKPLYFATDSGAGQMSPDTGKKRIDFGFTKYYKELKGKPASIDSSRRSNFHSFLKAVKCSNSVIESGDEHSVKSRPDKAGARKSIFSNKSGALNASHRSVKPYVSKDSYDVSHSPVRRLNTAHNERGPTSKAYNERGQTNRVHSSHEESMLLLREKAILEQEREEIVQLKEQMAMETQRIEQEKEMALDAKDREIEMLKEELRRVRAGPVDSTRSTMDMAEESSHRPAPSQSGGSEKINHLQRRIANLERQLRNRNKDYLFALKDLKKAKEMPGSDKICSVEDFDLP